MKDKVKRQLAIRNIIVNRKASSQEIILQELKSQGYNLTQATLSRDLKLLQVAKVSDPVEGYIYTIPVQEPKNNVPNLSRENFLADGFKDIKFSGNLAVVKTLPGYANSIAVVIDNANPWEIIGTIAGDDTILVVKREGITNSDLINSLINIMPNLKKKIG